MSDVTILDGGMGKELRRIGAPFRQPEWSALALMEAPDRVVEAHRNFVEAGAEVVTTNNYAVVPFHLGDDVFAERVDALTGLAGRLAREAADASGRHVRVAGSLPPLFGSYEPEHVDRERAAPIYRRIVDALAPSIDLWLGETLSTVVEMHLVVEAVRSAGSDAPIWISFTLPNHWSDGTEVVLPSGETLDEVVAAVAALRGEVSAVLVNCSLPEQTGPALASLRTSLDAAGLVDVRTGGYANAFPVAREDGYRANQLVFERREELTADHYADLVGGWIDDGATIVGGCCDMYPEHIAELSERFGGRETVANA